MVMKRTLGGQLMQAISRFSDLRVLIVGDAMLDGYLEGLTDRLCREAPVPVVSVRRIALAPGGAANAAANVASLGGKAIFLSVVGADQDGDRLAQSLEGHGVSAEYLLRDPSRQTLAKRRVIAGAQMLVRFDEGTTSPIAEAIEQALIDQLDALWPASDAVIISDYGYGVLTPRTVAHIADLQQRQPRVVVADSKHLKNLSHIGATAVKPNYGEATRLLGIPSLIGTCARAEQITAHGEEMLRITGAQIVAVTLDSEGAMVFECGNPPYRTYAEPNPDSHAAGAGDTFVSALALALAANADTPGAAELASAASTVVVGKEGTTTCSRQEIYEYFSMGDKYSPNPAYLLKQIEPQREQCRRIVFTNGCFDILHRGHITYLNQAKALGDILVVAVNSDESVRKLKGPNRPINSLADRVSVLSALSCVDYIISFNGDTPEELIRQIRPDVFVKGGDYTRDTLPEARVVEELGGTIEILPYIEDRSTTSIIQRIRASSSDVAA